MRKVLIGILVVALLVGGIIACNPFAKPFGLIVKPFGSIVFAAESSNTTVVEGSIMAVFWLKADEKVIYWCVDARIIDRGDGKWDVYSPQGSMGGVNQELVDYGLYSYKLLPNPLASTYYLDDLNLQTITADDLPKSEHIGKLTAVNVNLAKPATVTRKYMGVTYDVQCLVTQSVVNMWIADDLNIGDFVLVAFIVEVPNTTEIDVAIVTDKVYESW